MWLKMNQDCSRTANYGKPEVRRCLIISFPNTQPAMIMPMELAQAFRERGGAGILYAERTGKAKPTGISPTRETQLLVISPAAKLEIAS